jgi:hypothetical protein
MRVRGAARARVRKGVSGSTREGVEVGGSRGGRECEEQIADEEDDEALGDRATKPVSARTVGGTIRVVCVRLEGGS